MAQLLVRNFDPETKERLRRRTALNGMSMEAEARLILKLALAKLIIPQEESLEIQIAEMFDGVGMDFEIPKYSGEDRGMFVFPEEGHDPASACQADR